MANEFIARNGITSLGNIVVSGSITTTGTVVISGSIASASFAATASSADNFLTRGTLTAQTLVVQTITSSVDFVTGSTRFGSLLANTHVFSGSVTMNPNGLFVSSSGNVGIGTSSPTSNYGFEKNLTIASANNAELQLSQTANSHFLSIGITNGFNFFQTTAGQGYVYYIGGTERMRITSAGNFDYGGFNVQSSNNATYRQAFYGGLSIMWRNANDWYLNSNHTFSSANTNVATYANANGIGRLSATGGELAWETYDGSVTAGSAYSLSTKVLITKSGNVGIGTNNPTAQLQVSSASGGIISINSTVTNTFRGLIFQNNASSDGTEYAYLKYNATSGEFRIYANPAAFGGFMSFYSNNAESMRLNASGYLFVGVTTNSGFASAHRIKGPSATEGNDIISIDGGVEYAGLFKAVSGANYSGAGTGIIIGRNTSTGRSINAGGTINASGADYAEYMTKATTDIIAKGDIVGVNLEGKLTNIFNQSISFVVKSTDPSYVGGDIWGSVDNIGKLSTEATEEEKAAYNTKLEVERAKVDRIAFSGQVPCNVTGANVGDYIIPIELENGKISGQAVTNPTFEQYQISVGKVWKIMDDGRAWIAVKIG